MSEEPKSRREFVAIGLLGYVVVVGLLILFWNAEAGGLVENWYEEYVGPDGVISGSGKWRSVEGKAFRNTALLLGTWVYPFSVVTAGLFLRLAVELPGLARKLLCLAGGGVALYVLYRFLSLGLFRAIIGL